MHRPTTFKAKLRQIAYKIPGARRLRFGAAMTFGPRPDFIGWGMVATTQTPWSDGGAFYETAKRMSAAVASDTFRLSQFEHDANQQDVLNSLMWRHYLVHWSATYATGASGDLVECGVCDGLTAFFALSATDRKAYLYDAWAPMRADLMSASEAQVGAGRYEYLNVDTAKRNLLPFEDRCVFNKGYIPDVFRGPHNPSTVAWLHIDLNSAPPTKSSLEFFYPRMSKGGLVLFDDYGHHGCEDAKAVIDEFFSDKPGNLLPFPTGQAVYFVP